VPFVSKKGREVYRVSVLSGDDVLRFVMFEFVDIQDDSLIEVVLRLRENRIQYVFQGVVD
jgi:hypothetical protein